MEQSARNSYLEGQVMTATPQKLRLMLIEGAVRFAKQTLRLWDEQQNDAAVESLTRCRSIISELLSSVRPDNTDLPRKVAGVYVFLFKSLTEAQLHRDRKPVEDVISVLEVERETWRLVCEKMPHAPLAPAPVLPEITAADGPVSYPAAGHDAGLQGNGFVLDA
jgi:flagellar protein FliS